MPSEYLLATTHTLINYNPDSASIKQPMQHHIPSQARANDEALERCSRRVYKDFGEFQKENIGRVQVAADSAFAQCST